MRFRMILAAVLCLATQGAVAQSLDQLSGKSSFVRHELKSLKRKNAVSVYASTKLYCPSIYWYSTKPTSNHAARDEYRKQVNLEMEQAGFSAQAINHCITNSGFIFENRQLRSHPKNTNDRRYVEPGIMVYRQKNSTAIGSMPVLVDLSKTGKEHWRVYDASFKEFCTFTEFGSGFKAICNSFGAFNGPWTSRNGRNTATGSNNDFEIIFVTRRTPSFAKNLFRKTFGG